MNKHCLIIVFTVICLLLSPALKAQNNAELTSVKVTGKVTSPLDLNLNDFNQFKQSQVIRKDKAGEDHTYSGVLSSAILMKAGVTLGKALRGKNLAKYVLVEASDGYKVVFAVTELDQGFTERTIILADKMDGTPLPKGDGPFHIIVQDEKIPARGI